MRVFISYSHKDKDKEIAHSFRRYLIKRNIDVTCDVDIPIGANWHYEITKMMQNCDAFVFIISDNYLSSNFAQSELSLSLGYSNSLSKPIIPYIVANNSIPEILSQHLCLMGSSDIEADSSKLADQIDKIRGELIAQEEQTKEANKIAQEAATEKAKVFTRNLSQYTEKVFTRLMRNEKRDRCVAVLFYLIAMLFLGVGVIFSILKIEQVSSDISALQSIEYIISNILTLAIVIALSRLAFTLGKAFMTNALRNEDRIHAISFGEFFINAYGDEATRDEVRAVFNDWNIDKGTSFYSQSSNDFDPKIMSALNVIKNALSKKNDE
jgi:hypothetical protein